MAELGARNCITYHAFLSEGEGWAASNMATAAHDMVDSYKDRSVTAQMTDEEFRRVGVNGLVLRTIARNKTDLTFEDPDVYVALLQTIEQDCDSLCDDCPLAKVDLTVKDRTSGA